MPAVLVPRSGLLTAAVLLLSARLYGSLSLPNIAQYFGTKTRYEDANPDRSPGGSILRAPDAERCSPVHLTAVVRHGSRFPTTKNIRRIHKLTELVRREAGRGSAGSGASAGWKHELQNRWEMWYTEDMDGQLVEKGWDDLRQLAQRLSVLFPSLLSEENLRTGRLSVKSSSKHRCMSSAQAFQEGLLQAGGGARAGGGSGSTQAFQEGLQQAEDEATDVNYIHKVDDELLRFFDRCRSYVEGVENNSTALLEVEKFKHGDEMEAVRRRVADRLGLPLQHLSQDLLETAFFLCSYELSIKSVHSPWCFLFDEDDAKVLEYQSDLLHFWKRSHGHMITPMSSCPLFHHVFRTLDKAGRPRRSTDASPEPASILIGHAETLLPLLSLLGLYKDKTPPTAANYHSQHGRSFRSSKIVPYTANLLLVLFDCHRGPRLQMLINEVPVQFPGLKEDAPLYRDVRATYRHLLDNCDFHHECEGRLNRGPNTEL